MYLLLSAFSSSKLWRTLWASSSSAVGVCEMSSRVVGAWKGSTRLSNNLFLRDRLVGVAQAAALALRRTEGGQGWRQGESKGGHDDVSWFYYNRFWWFLSETRTKRQRCSQTCEIQLINKPVKQIPPYYLKCLETQGQKTCGHLQHTSDAYRLVSGLLYNLLCVCEITA